jgi:protein kinase-like protein/EF hand domain-containing protein
MSEATTYRNALALQSMLLEYRLEAVLGAGGFGMTYLGWDTHLEKHVAIKEYLPTDLAVRALDGSVVPVTSEVQHDYKWGLERFILEARTLAKFSHPHIVRVNRYFEANGTGYMVMDYEKGESLYQMLRRGAQLDEARLKGILMPLLDGLQAVHAAGFLHRDIKPGNIFVRDSGSPVLIDFGAARHAIGGQTRSLTSVLTPGYAPLEQYSTDGQQGPWSDIYAMAGVVYRVLVNDNPPDAVTRLKGDAVTGKLVVARGRVSETFLNAVRWALTLDEKQRPQSVQDWRRALEGMAGAPVTARAAASVATTARVGDARAGIAPAQPLPRTQAVQAGRPTRPPAPKRGSGWRWVGIAAVLAAAVVVIGSWSKQRAARTVEQGPVAAPASEEKWRKPAPAPADSRERPERERMDRPASVQPPGLEENRRRVLQEFRSADRDDDGYLSRDEVRGRFPFVEREFGRVDADGDGRISPDEFWRLRQMQAQQKFRKQ